MLESRVLEYFKHSCPLDGGGTLLVAVSGGPDSMALLHLLLAVRDSLGITLEVAHLDHGIRGKNAHEDAEFVARAAARQNLSLHQRRVDVPAIRERDGGSLEAVARHERYAFLQEAQAVAGARWVATGHTADDQVETFLMNLLRGAGPRGLGGMLPVGPGPVCRPLLETWRTELLEYLEVEGVEYRVDPTNADLSMTRNRIRRRVVPHLIQEFGNEVPRIFARESQLMNELDEYLSLESERVLRDLAEDHDRDEIEIRLPVRGLDELHAVFRRSVIRAAIEDLAGGLTEFTLGHIDAVVGLTESEKGSVEIHLPRGVLVRREYDTLILRLGPEEGEGTEAPEASHPMRLEGDGELRWGGLHLRWALEDPPEPPSEWARPDRICVDRAELTPPVYLRAAQPGDRIDPFGMAGSRKLSDLLIDRKVPRSRRKRIALLCDNGGTEGGERVLWVVGERRSRHAPVGPETSQVVLLEAETII